MQDKLAPEPSQPVGEDAPLGLITSRVAFVMPVYNEADEIENTVLELYQKAVRFLPNAKIILFEDGSKDNTKEIVNSLADRFSWVEVHTTAQRKGYPVAAKDAISSVPESLFEFVVFMDSDGQYDPRDFFSLWTAMSDKGSTVDIVVGKRTARAESTYRVILSSGLKTLERLLFSPPCSDITSAFRLMRIQVAREIALQVRYSKYNFWQEFTARMSQGGYNVREVDVSYRDRTGATKGKSNVYSLNRMPRIVGNELGAVIRTWLDFRRAQLIKFVSVGASGALAILALTFFFTSVLGLFYAVSAAISVEGSIIWAFTWNERWTFGAIKARRKWYERLARYNIISLGALTINETVLVALVTFFHAYYLVAEAIAIGVTFAFNFLANVKWTWHEKRMTP